MQRGLFWHILSSKNLGPIIACVFFNRIPPIRTYISINYSAEGFPRLYFLSNNGRYIEYPKTIMQADDLTIIV